MGNQQGKRQVQTFPFDEPVKKSRTDWTAGRSDVILATELAPVIGMLIM